MHICTETELQTMLDWVNTRANQFVLDDSQKNQIIIPLALELGGGRISSDSLDAAVAATFRSLNYLPGREHPVVKKELAEKRDRDRQHKNSNPPPRPDPRIDTH